MSLRHVAFGFTCSLMLMCAASSAAAQKVTFSAPPGEFGVWVPPNAGDERLVELDNPPAENPFAIETNPLLRTPRFVTTGTPVASFKKPTASQVPFQPWAERLYAYRQENQFEPHTRCKPSGGPRQFLTPYGVEVLVKPELERVFIVDIGGPHTLRIIYTDGRRHPPNLDPSYFGHSIGHWENETLVVDTVGFNEGFWFDRFGVPHTQQLHLVERFTRLDMTALQYEVMVDDPGAYTATWTTGILLRWNPTQDLFEYVCQDNNLAPELMVNPSDTISRHSPIVP